MSRKYALCFACIAIICILLVHATSSSYGATKISSIPIPRIGNKAKVLEVLEGYLYLGQLDSSGSLHCYSTSTNSLLWSASIGTVVSERLTKGYRSLTPRQVALSPSTQYVNVLAAKLDRLIVLNQSDGSIVATRDVPGAKQILTCNIANVDYVLVLCDGAIHVMEQSNVQTDVVQIPLPSGRLGGIEYDESCDTVYCVLQDNDTLVSCVVVSNGGMLSHILQTATTDSKPYDCELVGNSILVACTGSGTINQYSKSTMLIEAVHNGLTNVSFIKGVGSYLVVASYFNPVAGSTDYRGSIMFLDVISGASNTVNINDTYPVFVDTAPQVNSVVVFNEGMLETSNYSTYSAMDMRNGNMWVYNVSTSTLTDDTPLPMGYYLSAYCSLNQKMFVVEAGGTTIDVYTF